MKKGFKYYGIVWLLAVVLFNVISFAIPSTVMIGKFEGTYWVGYIFVMIAFIGQAACSYKFFKDTDNSNKVFLNLPIITVSYSALIVSTVVGYFVYDYSVYSSVDRCDIMCIDICYVCNCYC